MEIKRVVQLQSALRFAEKDRIVEMAFILNPPAPKWLTVQEETELNQKEELDAKELLNFIRTLPIGTVKKLLKLLQEELSYLITSTTDA